MRVHLSPWEVAETSLHAAKKRRRQSRASSGSGGDETVPLLGLTARFISHRKSSKKARVNIGEHLVPTLLLTGEHRISVVGTCARDTGIQESELLQYSSRLGRTTSFLPKADGKTGIPQIPAIYDTKYERIYALQKENTRLLCWPAASGPEEAHTVNLDQPAVDLKLFRRRDTSQVVLYGSCQDGRIFLVETVADSNSMKIVYVRGKNEEAVAKFRVVSTLMFPVIPKETVVVGSKRKTNSNAAEEWRLVIYQILLDHQQGRLILIHHEIVLSQGDSGPQVSTNNSRTATVRLAPSDGSESEQIRESQVVGVCEEMNAITIRYNVVRSPIGKENGDSSVHQGHFYAMLSLDTATLVGAPAELPVDTRSVGLVSCSVLAINCKDGIQLFDLLRASRIHQQAFPPRNDEYGIELVTDEKRSRLLLIFVEKDSDKVCVAMPSGKFQQKVTALTQGPVSLASGLAASLETSMRPAFQMRDFCRERGALTFDSCSSGTASISRMDEGLEQGITTILSAYATVLESSSKVPPKPSIIVDNFESALKKAAGKETAVLEETPDVVTIVADNPQDAIPSIKDLKSNGDHQSIEKVLMLKNGVTSPTPINGTTCSAGTIGLTDIDAPRPLIECAAAVVVCLLCDCSASVPIAVKSNASLLLQRLIRTKKVFARTHLVPNLGDSNSFAILLRALELLADGASEICYNPLEFIADVCAFCPDMSERQMVASLHYVMCRASLDDVARFLGAQSDERVKKLIDRYMALNSTETGCDEADNEELELISGKLLKFGVTQLLIQVLSYGYRNESLLRLALTEVLNPSEMGILARLVADLLTGARLEAESLDSKFCKSAASWLSALCDCLNGSEASDFVDLQAIRKKVSLEISRTEAMLSLHNIVGLVGSEKREQAETKKAETSSSGQPPYQIERLLF